jgi:hypothetical protein
VRFELFRSDIGFGKLIVDDTGITRERLFRTRRIEWAEVREYRLAATPQSRSDFSRLFGLYEVGADFVAALRGDRRPMRYDFELIGEQRRLVVNWRFDHVELAIEEALRHIGPRLLDEARRSPRFGPLAIHADAVAWKTKPPLARSAVEAFEVSDTAPRRLRVLQHGRTFAYASATLSAIPNVLHALELADELGYRVRGRELLQLFERADVPTPPARAL